MRRAIVSGANGFIGSALVRELIQHGVHVWALVRNGRSNNVPVSDLVTVVPFDMDNVIGLLTDLSERGFDVFFHLAWTSTSGDARTNTVLQLRNVQNTVNCLKVAKLLGCHRFVNASSIHEIESYRATFSQGGKPHPGRAIYGGSKLAAHIMCESLSPELGIEFISALITNTYGPGEISERLVNSTIRKCMRGEKPQFTSATQLYDFVYIDDMARAFRMIGEKGKAFHEYTIGSSQVKPLHDFLLELNEAVAPEIDFVFGAIPFTGSTQPASDFDSSELEKDTGFRAEISFAEGVRRTRDWLAKQGEKV